MLHGKTISVVIPAYNEELHIRKVIETLPNFVDRIVFIDDSSTDNTFQIVQSLLPKFKNSLPTTPIPKFINGHPIYCSNNDDSKIIIIQHLKNRGKGAGIQSGYLLCEQLGIECIATMDGDGQMDAHELEKICLPIVLYNVDYTKGNRLNFRDVKQTMPSVRYWGNVLLSIFTKFSSGYFRVWDSQTGFTAISKKALRCISITSLYHYYGYENEILVKLNIANCSIKEVSIKPIYHDITYNKMKIYQVIPKISWLLFRLFFQRIWTKYLLNSFHPIFLLYHICVLSFLLVIYHFFRDSSQIYNYILLFFSSGLIAFCWDMKKGMPLHVN